MLTMIQRIFYGPQSTMVTERPSRDFRAHEHILLWPMAALMIAMGVASPFWMRAIDQGVKGFSYESSQTIAAPHQAKTLTAVAAAQEKR
jgi:NADH-quinone oxidoreductase subunit M